MGNSQVITLPTSNPDFFLVSPTDSLWVVVASKNTGYLIGESGRTWLGTANGKAWVSQEGGAVWLIGEGGVFECPSLGDSVPRRTSDVPLDVLKGANTAVSNYTGNAKKAKLGALSTLLSNAMSVANATTTTTTVSVTADQAQKSIQATAASTVASFLPSIGGKTA